MGMTYRVEIRKSAAKALARIATKDRGRIAEAIKALANDPRPAGCKAMQDREGYRIRVGNYRVLYTVDDQVHVVDVISIGHRREIYR